MLRAADLGGPSLGWLCSVALSPFSAQRACPSLCFPGKRLPHESRMRKHPRCLKIRSGTCTLTCTPLFWPRQVPWPNTRSSGWERYSAPLVEKIAKSRGERSECREGERSGDNDTRYHTKCSGRETRLLMMECLGTSLKTLRSIVCVHIPEPKMVTCPGR